MSYIALDLYETLSSLKRDKQRLLFGESDNGLRAFSLPPASLFFYLMATVYWIIVTEVWRISKRKIKRNQESIRKINTFLINSSLIYLT